MSDCDAGLSRLNLPKCTASSWQGAAISQENRKCLLRRTRCARWFPIGRFACRRTKTAGEGAGRDRGERSAAPLIGLDGLCWRYSASAPRRWFRARPVNHVRSHAGTRTRIPTGLIRIVALLSRVWWGPATPRPSRRVRCARRHCQYFNRIPSRMTRIVPTRSQVGRLASH